MAMLIEVEDTTHPRGEPERAFARRARRDPRVLTRRRLEASKKAYQSQRDERCCCVASRAIRSVGRLLLRSLDEPREPTKCQPRLPGDGGGT